jgi:NTP pyrophosphatase (non-canonical NTP hydrolase)
MSFNIQNPVFNFNVTSMTNWNRCVSEKGFNMDPDSEKWKGDVFNLYLVNTMAQEAGEIGAVITKLLRGFNQREYRKMLKKVLPIKNEGLSSLEVPSYEECKKQWESYMQYKLKEESADLFGYFDLFLTNNNIDIRRAFTQKFNQVSEDMGCPQFKL